LHRIADVAQLIFPIGLDRPKAASALMRHLSRLPEFELANNSALESYEASERRLRDAGFSASELTNCSIR